MRWCRLSKTLEYVMAMLRTSDPRRIRSRPGKILFAVFPIGIVALLFLIFDLISNTTLFNQSQTKGSSQQISRLSTYRIPDSLDFCGERMPLEIPDVRERMEQAFYMELSDGQIILDLKRSTRYFPYIEQKLRDMNLPNDLEYLPVAESALKNAVSSRSAAGVWQFTDDAARQYGLRINEFVDERFNFRKETDAALKYLMNLHSKFGNWTLAAAAYNMGTGGVKASLDYQMVDSYYSLYLNDETFRFVFRIVALKQIISHYRMYGFDMSPQDFYQPSETKLIVVTRVPDIATWARNQGSSYKEVKYLNPWLINRSLPAGTWAIELPKYSQPVVFTSASPVIDSTDEKSGVNGSEVAPSTGKGITYVVKRGDTLQRIAVTYGVSVRDLVIWNNLRDGSHLRIGEKLEIIIGSSEQDQ
jgi:peptidoglycan lytic transglycosylase D